MLDALADADCREIVRALDEPMTAREIADATDIPLSTTYRKLELLSAASLLDERVAVRADGSHATRYALDVAAVSVTVDGENSIRVAIRRRDREPDERLSELWAAVREEL